MHWLVSKNWNDYVPAAEVISGFATAVALIIGAISLFLLWFQSRQAANVARETAAYDAHKEYHAALHPIS